MNKKQEWPKPLEDQLIDGDIVSLETAAHLLGYHPGSIRRLIQRHGAENIGVERRGGKGYFFSLGALARFKVLLGITA